MGKYYRRRKSSGISNLVIFGLIALGFASIVTQLIPQNIEDYLPLFYALIFLSMLIGTGFLLYLRAKDRKRIRALELSDVDHMSGEDFERYFGEILKSQGYKVSFTPKSGDYGTDIVAHKGTDKINVQLKRYAKNVGVEAVQQVHASREYYKCNQSMVVTNSFYTPNAKIFATFNECTLIDRTKLSDIILQFQSM